MKKLLLSLLLGVPLILYAGTYSRDYKPVSKATIDSTAMKAELDAIGTVINGNITGADNIKDGSIKTADLDDAIITSAKISYVAPEKIKTETTSATMQDMLNDWIDGCNIVYKSDTQFYVTSGSAFINAKLRTRTDAVTITPTQLDSGDWTDTFITADNATSSSWSTEVVDSGASPGGSTPTATNYRMVGSINWDTSQDLFNFITYRRDRIIGWDSAEGAGTANANLTITVTFGKTFSHTPNVLVTFLGRSTTTPTGDIGNYNNGLDLSATVCADSITTTGFTATLVPENGEEFTNTHHYGISWVAYGDYS
jgi:hypothetical protein